MFARVDYIWPMANDSPGHWGKSEAVVWICSIKCYFHKIDKFKRHHLQWGPVFGKLADLGLQLF